MNRFRLWAFALLLVVFGGVGYSSARPAIFIFPPYLQLGTGVRVGTLTVTWVVPEDGAEWSVEATGGRAGAVHDVYNADSLGTAGARFPRMGSFSFDWGCAHWLFLDSNRHVDWTDPSLRRRVAADLAAAQGAACRFVVMHHPGFQGARRHRDDQWMRSLSDLFEQGRVSIVFAGHVHNYQRSRPLRFRPVRQADGRIVAADGRVDGHLEIDDRFDGVRRTCPSGVVYVVSGAGGSRLYPMEPPPDALWWGDFTTRAVADEWSVTDLVVGPRAVTLRQLGVNGQDLDHMTITP